MARRLGGTRKAVAELVRSVREVRRAAVMRGHGLASGYDIPGSWDSREDFIAWFDSMYDTTTMRERQSGAPANDVAVALWAQFGGRMTA
jgi:hypothetical protein